MKWKLFSHVQLFAIPWTIIHGILQARILEWVAFPFSRGSSQLTDGIQAFTLQADSLPAESQGKPNSTGVGSLSLLQGIFPTQELNQGLLHYRRILYQLSYQGSPPKNQASLNFMAAVTVHSDFGAQENKVCHCFHFTANRRGKSGSSDNNNHFTRLKLFLILKLKF